MKKLTFQAVIVALIAALVLLVVLRSPVTDLGAQTNHAVTEAMVDRWMMELSNWGRWGKDDKKGTLNLLTLETRKRSLSSAREGFSVSLSDNYIEQPAEEVMYPFVREMIPFDPASQFSVDRYSVRYHGYAHSHMDALCHDSYQGKIYNGFPRTTVTHQGRVQQGRHHQLQARHCCSCPIDRHPTSQGRPISRTQYADLRGGY